MRTILITGCSSGIGYDAAVTLKARGWRVFAACRQQIDVDRLRAEGLEAVLLDYRDSAGMQAAVSEVLEATGGTLDALFNNGAFALPGFVEDLPRDGLRDIFEVNLFGQFELINLLMPTFRAQGRGRIVNCSSVLGIAAMRGRGAYNATKFAMEGLSDTMRLELHGSGIDLSLILPGPIPTRIRQNAQANFETWIDWRGSARRAEYEAEVMPRLYDESGTPDAFEQPVSAVTAKLIHAVEARRPHARYYVTAGTWIARALTHLPTRWRDMVMRRS